MNSIHLVGRLGADPERRGDNGPVVFTSTWSDADGNRQEQTQWHRIVVWGKQADACERYLRKGDRVAIEGELRYTQWTSESGERHKSAEIIARRVHFISPQQRQQQQQPRRSRNPYDEVPF